MNFQQIPKSFQILRAMTKAVFRIFFGGEVTQKNPQKHIKMCLYQIVLRFYDLYKNFGGGGQTP